MITTANYVGRKFGVRSAMPGFIAMYLCPQLKLVPCNYRKYQAVSSVMKEIVSEYDPHFASMGLDEVNMDVTDFLKENDMEAYAELVQETKNGRLKFLLNETDGYMNTINQVRMVVP